MRVIGDVPFDSPAFAAGLERDDRILSIGGASITSEAAAREAIARRKPGEDVAIDYQRRGGERATATMRLVADPRVDIVTFEEAGRPLSEAQRRFRRAWLGSER